MIDIDLPTAPSTTPLARGFAACLASVTEVPVADLPLPAGDLPQALGAWRSWLAGRGSGLVTIADPTAFQWAGWWLAVVRAGDTEVATVAVGTPPGIVLSPQDPDLLGRYAVGAGTFSIGDVLCEGARLCEPCVHLDRLSGPGLLRPLIHKGGLRVDVLTDGEIRLGAPIKLV